MTEAVAFERDGTIVTLTLNKPDARNPTTDPDILDALNAAFARPSRACEMSFTGDPVDAPREVLAGRW